MNTIENRLEINRNENALEILYKSYIQDVIFINGAVCKVSELTLDQRKYLSKAKCTVKEIDHGNYRVQRFTVIGDDRIFFDHILYKAPDEYEKNYKEIPETIKNEKIIL